MTVLLIAWAVTHVLGQVLPALRNASLFCVSLFYGENACLVANYTLHTPHIPELKCI